MPVKEKEMPGGSISDDSVIARTGKSKAEWFKILDRAGATKMDHTQIAAYLYQEHGCPGWWSQMVTVEYERARGLRERHQTPTGYQVSATKAIAAPLAEVFNAWTVEKVRKLWLSEEISIRKINPGKNIRVGWTDETSNLDVRFYSKGDSKTQITVDHTKLSDAQSAARMKTFWAGALSDLKSRLES